jgi:NAD(P)-dependent dehydrogenase (short-subunit alcohol dehydrogenase family)
MLPRPREIPYPRAPMPTYDHPVTATLAAIGQRLRKEARRATSGRLDEKTALVTGASRGLGRAVAEKLAERGASIVLPTRAPAEDVERAIIDRGGRAEAESIDLADLRTVIGLAERMRGRAIDLLILNAGVVPNGGRATAQRFELQNGVNLLANVLLVDRLIGNGGLASDARIVVVSSESHRSAKEIDLDALGVADSYGIRGVMPRYASSKLMLTAWAQELSRELAPGRAVHTICPGPVRSDLARETPWIGQLALKPIMRVFFTAPEVAAEPVVHLACDAKGTGTYFHRWEKKEPSPLALDRELARRVCERSRALLAERIGS